MSGFRSTSTVQNGFPSSEPPNLAFSAPVLPEAQSWAESFGSLLSYGLALTARSTSILCWFGFFPLCLQGPSLLSGLLASIRPSDSLPLLCGSLSSSRGTQPKASLFDLWPPSLLWLLAVLNQLIFYRPLSLTLSLPGAPALFGWLGNLLCVYHNPASGLPILHLSSLLLPPENNQLPAPSFWAPHPLGRLCRPLCILSGQPSLQQSYLA